MRTYLVAGGTPSYPPAELAPRPGDWVIAVDSGLLTARAWGWPVHALIGDLDSLPLAEVPDAGAELEIIRAPRAKDETDLELALFHALARGAREILICAALGGRLDHTLANVLLLCRPDLAGRDVSIVEHAQTIRLLRGGETLVLAGAAGDLLSLLPVGGDAVGIRTGGLVYPLQDETLFLGQARGVSNVFAAATAEVALDTGLLLVIHQRGV